MASPSKEKSSMATERANATPHHWHHHLQRLDKWSAGQEYPLQRLLCALPTAACEAQNPVHGGDENSAPIGVEESPANFWTARATNAALDCRGVIAAQAATHQPDHPQQQQHHRFGPCISLPLNYNQRPLHQQHQQSQSEVHISPMAAECVFGHTTSMGGRNHGNSRTIADSPFHQHGLQHHPRGGGAGVAMNASCNVEKSTGNVCNGGLGQGGRGRCWKVVDGQIGGGSPKSSVSSDESAEGLVGNSPTAVWEVGMRRGGFGGRGGRDVGGSSGSGGRKRSLEAGDANAIAMLQPQTTTTQDERSIDEMKQLLLCTSMELESPRTSAMEETRNREENLEQLIQFIKITMLERDEAKEQLQKLHAEIGAERRPQEHSPTPPHHPHGLAYSLELPNLSKTHSSDTALAHRPPLYEDDAFTPPGISSGTAKFDAASAIIDRLAMCKALPEKGKLLQAVLDAGPLLQTLLVAGALPLWRNPPPLRAVQVPPLSAIPNQNAFFNQNLLVQMSPDMFHHRNPCVASQIPAPFPVDSPSLRSLCMRGTMPARASSCQDTVGKRQRI